jgi:hypothetical protein
MCEKITLSENQVTIKFPTAIAINNKPNENVMSVSCKIEDSHPGGKRSVTVVKSAAMETVTINGTDLTRL